MGQVLGEQNVRRSNNTFFCFVTITVIKGTDVMPCGISTLSCKETLTQKGKKFAFCKDLGDHQQDVQDLGDHQQDLPYEEARSNVFAT